MAKRRSSVRKREREIEKRQRDARKARKAADKRERRFQRDQPVQSANSEDTDVVAGQNEPGREDGMDSEKPDVATR